MSGDRVHALRFRLNDEFSVLLDYIWKTPRFIASEIVSERRKLDEYFPAQIDPDLDQQFSILRGMRASAEGAKLFGGFPRYLAASNLFLSTSIFEKFLFEFCELAETSELTIASHRGNGVSRYLKFLINAGQAVQSNSYFEQIDAAITFRNALLHADGRLEVSRDKEKIERIVRDLRYLQKDRREGGCPLDENGNPEVRISIEPKTLRIDNYYAYRSAAYFRNFLLELTGLGFDQMFVKELRYERSD